MGKRVRPKTSEVYKLICDYEHAKNILGWKPDVSLSEGLDQTIDFISRNESFYKINKYEI